MSLHLIFLDLRIAGRRLQNNLEWIGIQIQWDLESTITIIAGKEFIFKVGHSKELLVNKRQSKKIHTNTHTNTQAKKQSSFFLCLLCFDLILIQSYYYAIFTGNNDPFSFDISVEEEEEEGSNDGDEGHAGTPPEHDVEARAEPGVDVGGKEEVEHRANAADSESGSEGSGEVVVLEVSVGDSVLGNADATKTSAEHNYTRKCD